MDKKFVYLISGLLVLVLVGGGIFYYSKNKQNPLTSTQNQKITQNQEVNFNQEATNSNDKNVQTTTEKQNTQSTEQEKYYTMEDVAQHNSKESCWAVIKGDVYDLTEWINKHPGGADKILYLCGKDGTEAFEKKHSGQEKPEKTLEKFEIGKLKQ
jgi:cytochrome b involved in lipid metabolism